MATQSFKLDMKDYTPQVLKAMREQVQKGLIGIGAEAEGYAKKECPVDTGRLRNSITFATSTYHSESNTNKSPQGPQDAEPSEYATHATSEENAVYIGTNVAYAEQIEYKDMSHKVGKAHFLRDSLANHGDHYKSIMEAALKS